MRRACRVRVLFRPWSRGLVPVVLFPAVLLSSCSTGAEGRLEIVASAYPLAWAAGRVGGEAVAVEDLTPPGGEAHDAVLTAAQRAEIQTAPLVLILGRFGFQPEVERAATEAEGLVVEVAASMDLLAAESDGLSADPHVWLDPEWMVQIVRTVADGLAEADPDRTEAYRARAEDAIRDLEELGAAYAAGLEDCAFRVFVVTHEAFGYLAARYGFQELGLRGLAPESEPTAVRLEAALGAIRTGRAAPAVFHEATEEGRRTAEAVASEAGVPVLPLSALEAAPAEGDYLSVMRDNLDRLREGLGCR